jgi:site-specific recombinase XerD
VPARRSVPSGAIHKRRAGREVSSVRSNPQTACRPGGQFRPEHALAASTRKAYEHDWRVFATWCAQRGLAAIPAQPATVAAFLAAESDREFRPVTIARRAAAIAAAHRAQDEPNPCDSGAVAAVMSGIRPRARTEPRRQAKPLELDPLGRLIESIEVATLAGRRDRALLLLGFAVALRRSELVALDVEDLRFGVTGRSYCSGSRPRSDAPSSSPWTSRTSASTWLAG